MFVVACTSAGHILINDVYIKSGYKWSVTDQKIQGNIYISCTVSALGNCPLYRDLFWLRFSFGKKKVSVLSGISTRRICSRESNFFVAKHAQFYIIRLMGIPPYKDNFTKRKKRKTAISATSHWTVISYDLFRQL